jgi:uncharacterized protein YkwD
VTQTDEMQRMLRLHNEARKKLNLRPLSLHPKLHESAKQQALYMAQKGKKTHVGPGGSKIKERIKKVGYPLAGAHCAENAAAGGGELGAPDNVFHLWMESTDHRENILREDMQDVGFGSATGASGKWFWCADFARPQG